MILEKTFDLIPPGESLEGKYVETFSSLQLVHLLLNLQLQNHISVSSVNVDQLVHVNSPLYLPAMFE